MFYCDFLYRDYRFKLIVTQIPPDEGLEPIPYTGQEFFPHQESTSAAFPSTFSKYQALNRMTTGLEPFISVSIQSPYSKETFRKT